MIRNLKALGLALFAILAMGALAAASASAQEGEVFATNAVYPVHLTGEDVTATAGDPTPALTGSDEVIECSESTYTGNLTTVSKRITIIPTYNKCSSGASPVTVTMNGCDYEFHHATTVVGNTDAWAVTADLKCPVGKVVEIHKYSSAANHTSGSSNCTLTLSQSVANSNLPGSTIYEETNGDAIDSLRIEGTVKPAAQTHGACSFGFTVNIGTSLHISATVTGNEPVGIKH